MLLEKYIKNKMNDYAYPAYQLYKFYTTSNINFNTIEYKQLLFSAPECIISSDILMDYNDILSCKTIQKEINLNKNDLKTNRLLNYGFYDEKYKFKYISNLYQLYIANNNNCVNNIAYLKYSDNTLSNKYINNIDILFNNFQKNNLNKNYFTEDSNIFMKKINTNDVYSKYIFIDKDFFDIIFCNSDLLYKYKSYIYIKYEKFSKKHIKIINQIVNSNFLYPLPLIFIFSAEHVYISAEILFFLFTIYKCLNIEKIPCYCIFSKIMNNSVMVKLSIKQYKALLNKILNPTIIFK